MAILTEDRTVAVTAEAAAKAADSQGHLETVFSAALLPVDFFRDVLRGHSAKGMLPVLRYVLFFFFVFNLFLSYLFLSGPLATGQGSAARACLLERIPYFGFVLSEHHARKMEIQLTEFLLAELKKEGSSHFRPEAVQTAEESNPDPKKGKKNKTEETETAEPKKKLRKTTKPKKEEEDEVKEEEDVEEGKGSPLPW